MKEEKHWFERGARYAMVHFSWLLKKDEQTENKIKKSFSKDYLELLAFTGLNVEPQEILVFTYATALLSIVFVLAFVLCVFVVHLFAHFSIDWLTIVLVGIIVMSVPIVLVNFLKTYPKTYAKYLQIHSLGDIPEVLSYLVMYLKLIPNLENSIKFTATESSTVLAADLRKLVWDLEIRLYHGIDDAITKFATRWGTWSEYFKRSMHLLRSSIHEREETSRIVTLDRALDVSLEGTKETMNKFVNSLHQPTVLLFSIGIMIPLSLVAMLPATSLIGVKFTIFQVFLLYDIVLPLFVFLYTRKILLSRPATFHPPHIPSDHPEIIAIDKLRRFCAATVLGCFIALPGTLYLLLPVLSVTSFPHPVVQIFFEGGRPDSIFPRTLFIIWGIGAAISFYCLTVYRPYKKIRDSIRKMENEFSDALYILGKRISEEKSPEESFLYTAQTMEGATIAEVFRQTSYNLTAMHINFHDALFDAEVGSVRHVYSDRIRAILRLFVEGAQKSQQAVSASLIRIADHLKQLQEVEHKIKDMLYDLTSTIQTTILIFAPCIAGVTLSITTMISSILSSLNDPISSSTMEGLPPTFSEISKAFTVENIRPEYFVLVIGIYLLQLVILLSRFTNGINEGDDKATYMYDLGKIIPVTIAVFSLTVVIGQWFFSQLVPTPY